MDQPQNPNYPDPLRPADDPVGPASRRSEGETGGTPVPPTEAPPTDATPPAEAPPLTPAAWLTANGPYLLVLAAIVGVVWYKFGIDGIWYGAKVVFGLGFVIFIHELGHFLTAKWCDVHVQTFSIGFGPALPGCSFQRGETTYKIGVLPLGGYVNMVGEGPEADEDENYPRSFKNKSVGQRMLIISAGVIMNVLLGCALFIAVYYYHGVDQAPAIVGRVDPASPMWLKGVPSGTVITELNGIKKPVFKNLRIEVILSGKDQTIPFTFVEYGPDGQRQGERSVDLLPRKDEDDLNPVVGLSPPDQLRLMPRPKKDLDVLPVTHGSAAAAARPVPVKPEEVITACTDPDEPDKLKELNHDVKAGTFDYLEFSRRLRKLEGKKLVVRVVKRGTADPVKAEERDVPVTGFQFNDAIIGCTEAQDVHKGAYNPFRWADLPRDPRHEHGDRLDPFVFHARERQLAGLPMVVRVRRGDPNSSSPRHESSSGEEVNLFVPPAFHSTFGMRMKMGKVAGVREGSPLDRARLKKGDEEIRLQRGDELVKVVLTDEQGEELRTWEDLDPERLPYQLAKAASEKSGKKKVALTFRREPSAPNQEFTLPPVEWDERWDSDQEVPLSASSPVAIPQLGVAYWVLSQVVEVEKDSPAATAKLEKDGSPAPLKKGDTIKKFRIKELSPYGKEPAWSGAMKMESKRNGSPRDDRWAQAFHYVQVNDYKEIAVEVNRPGEEVKDALVLTAREDPTWPLVSRGIHLMADYKVLQADSFGEALILGARDTKQMIVIMYMQLKSLATGRVSVEQMGGPLEMMRQGFLVAQSGNFELLLFLGMISINLAVVNFLPIPILDGGHMVFLIYEKLRGRPPTDNVKIIATYIGLAMIALLMILVFYQDIRKMFGI